MTGFTDVTAQAGLDALVITYPWLGLFTVAGFDDGTGFTEVSGGSYARVNTSGLWNAAGGSAPSTKSNSSAITFPAATASWGTVLGFFLSDSVSAGIMGAWDYIGGFAWQPCFVSSGGGSPGVLMAAGHSLMVGNNVVYSTEYGGTMPTFSASDLTGMLTVAHATTDTFDVTNSGIIVNTSSTGNGQIRRITPKLIDLNPITQIQFDSGSLVLSSA